MASAASMASSAASSPAELWEGDAEDDHEPTLDALPTYVDLPALCTAERHLLTHIVENAPDRRLDRMALADELIEALGLTHHVQATHVPVGHNAFRSRLLELFTLVHRKRSRVDDRADTVHVAQQQTHNESVEDGDSAAC